MAHPDNHPHWAPVIKIKIVYVDVMKGRSRSASNHSLDLDENIVVLNHMGESRTSLDLMSINRSMVFSEIVNETFFPTQN